MSVARMPGATVPQGAAARGGTALGVPGALPAAFIAKD